MSIVTLDTAIAKHLAQNTAISGAAIVGGPGGWSVLLTVGGIEKRLGTQRSERPRLWRSLDRCVAYLKAELGITRIDFVDARLHQADAQAQRGRSDTAERMRRTHQAAAYDAWFREQVQAAQADPRPVVANADAKQGFALRRAALSKRSKAARL